MPDFRIAACVSNAINANQRLPAMANGAVPSIPKKMSQRLSCSAVLGALDRDESTARPTIFCAGVAEARATTEANAIERSPDAVPTNTNEEISPDHVRQPPSRHLQEVTPTERSPP